MLVSRVRRKLNDIFSRIRLLTVWVCAEDGERDDVKMLTVAAIVAWGVNMCVGVFHEGQGTRSRLCGGKWEQREDMNLLMISWI
jgi:hypothetical protein